MVMTIAIVLFIIFLSSRLLVRSVDGAGQANSCDIINGVCKDVCSPSEKKWTTPDCEQVCCASETGSLKEPEAGSRLKVIMTSETPVRLYHDNKLELTTGEDYNFKVSSLSPWIDDCAIYVYRPSTKLWLRTIEAQTPAEDNTKYGESSYSYYERKLDCQEGFDFSLETKDWWRSIAQNEGRLELRIRGYDSEGKKRDEMVVKLELKRDEPEAGKRLKLVLKGEPDRIVPHDARFLSVSTNRNYSLNVISESNYIDICSIAIYRSGTGSNALWLRKNQNQTPSEDKFNELGESELSYYKVESCKGNGFNFNFDVEKWWIDVASGSQGPLKLIVKGFDKEDKEEKISQKKEDESIEIEFNIFPILEPRGINVSEYFEQIDEFTYYNSCSDIIFDDRCDGQSIDYPGIDNSCTWDSRKSDCYDCSEERLCDYMGDEASCLRVKPNCLGQTFDSLGCHWKDRLWFIGGDKCEYCEENVECSDYNTRDSCKYDTCSSPHPCYWLESEDNCVECQAPLRCEMYEDEETCEDIDPCYINTPCLWDGGVCKDSATCNGRTIPAVEWECSVSESGECIDQGLSCNTNTCACEEVCGDGQTGPTEQCENDNQCNSGELCVGCECINQCGNNNYQAALGEECDGNYGTCQPYETCNNNCECEVTRECIHDDDCFDNSEFGLGTCVNYHCEYE